MVNGNLIDTQTELDSQLALAAFRSVSPPASVFPIEPVVLIESAVPIEIEPSGVTPTVVAEADLELAERVLIHLTNQHRFRFRGLSIEARQGTITVRGQFATWHERQICQACCRRVAGVYRIVDEIEVAPQPTAPPPTSSEFRGPRAALWQALAGKGGTHEIV